MANARSDWFANVLAKPPVMNSMGSSRAEVKTIRVEVATLVGHGAGHYYPLFRLPAQARLWSLKVSNTADAGLTDCNIGLYQKADWTLADGVVIDEDILVDGANIAAASGVAVERLGAGTTAYAEGLEGKPLWQVAGVAADPGAGVEYDIALRSVGDPAGGATIVVIAQFSDNT